MGRGFAQVWQHGQYQPQIPIWLNTVGLGCGSVKYYAQIYFWNLVEIYYWGRLNRPWLHFSRLGANGQGRCQPLVTPLTSCGLPVISRPSGLLPWLPDASCSCTFCSPTVFRLHDAVGHTPTSKQDFRPGRCQPPVFCVEFPCLAAQLRCWCGFCSSVPWENRSR